MGKLLWLLPAFLLFFVPFGSSLECYNCYVTNYFSGKDATMVPCNERNMTASNTAVCPHPNGSCVYQVFEIEALKTRQVWRTYSNGVSDPCDPNSAPPGFKMITCKQCSTDRCNLFLEKEEDNKTFNFNINANVNLNIN